MRESCQPQAQQLRNHAGATLLHLAAGAGQADVVDLLLEKYYANSDIRDDRGRTAEHYAGWRAKRLEKDFPEKESHSPEQEKLGEATQRILETLRADRARQTVLLSDPELGLGDRSGRTVLHHAAASGNRTHVESCLKAGAPVWMRDSGGMTPLAAALHDGHPEVAGRLAEIDPEWDFKNRYGENYLLCAAYGCSPEAIDWVFDNHPDPVGLLSETDNHGDGPLSLILMAEGEFKEGNKAMAIDRLLQRARQAGVEQELFTEILESRDGTTGKTALLSAVEQGDTPAARVLLQHGADPNTSKEGFSALLAGVVARNPEVVLALLEHGANPKDGRQPAWAYDPLSFAQKQAQENSDSEGQVAWDRITRDLQYAENAKQSAAMTKVPEAPSPDGGT